MRRFWLLNREVSTIFFVWILLPEAFFYLVIRIVIKVAFAISHWSSFSFPWNQPCSFLPLIREVINAPAKNAPIHSMISSSVEGAFPPVTWLSGSRAFTSVFYFDLYFLYRKQHLFNRIGSNTKDHQDSNGLDEIDVGGSEVVHASFLALANFIRITGLKHWLYGTADLYAKRNAAQKRLSYSVFKVLSPTS